MNFAAANSGGGPRYSTPDPLAHLGGNQVIKERQTENKRKNKQERDMVGFGVGEESNFFGADAANPWGARETACSSALMDCAKK
jgi:hypothetical protein